MFQFFSQPRFTQFHTIFMFSKRHQKVNSIFIQHEFQYQNYGHLQDLTRLYLPDLKSTLKFNIKIDHPQNIKSHSFIYNKIQRKMHKNSFPPYFYQGQKILNAEEGHGQVWISGMHFASDFYELKLHNITAVVSATDLGIVFPSSINHYKLDLRDTQDEEIRYTFFPVFRFVQQQRKKGNVLIHCAAGVSRSASLLIAYMMRKLNKSYEACLRIVKAGRPCVCPNKGFMRQLKGFGQDLGVKD